MTKPLFSICVPVFNGEPHLSKCLSSIEEQTFKDFEVVIVDDGSSDRSVEIITEFKKRNKNLVFARNKVNMGLVGNWNKCISLSNGTWIKFLFQDDTWRTDCLELTYRHTTTNDFIFHGRNFVFEGDVQPFLLDFYTSSDVNEYRGLIDQKKLSPDQIGKLVSQSPGFNFFGEPSNIAFKKELVGTYGDFDDRLVQLCDYEYWVRLSSNTGAYYISDKVSTFRVHSKAASTSNSIDKHFRFTYLDLVIILRKFAFDSVYESLRKNNSNDLFLMAYKEQELKTTRMLSGLSVRQYAGAIKQVRKYAPFADVNVPLISRVKLYFRHLVNYAKSTFLHA